jgi:hypothetical protein
LFKSGRMSKDVPSYARVQPVKDGDCATPLEFTSKMAAQALLGRHIQYSALPHTFTGILTCIRRSSSGTTFTLRSMVGEGGSGSAIGVEMTFAACSPALVAISLVSGPHPKLSRRAKMYYLRDKPPVHSTVHEPNWPALSIPTLLGVPASQAASIAAAAAGSAAATSKRGGGSSSSDAATPPPSVLMPHNLVQTIPGGLPSQVLKLLVRDALATKPKDGSSSKKTVTLGKTAKTAEKKK